MDEQQQPGGLLNFFQSPGGQGLLSAIAGYAAGARRGTPVNNIGKGLLSGVTGYQNAQEEYKKTQQQNALKQFFGLGSGGTPQEAMQAGQAPSGLAGKTIDQVAALKAVYGVDVLEPWKTAQTGLEQKGGNYYIDPVTKQSKYLPNVEPGITYNPQTQQAGPIGGYAQAKAAQAGAVAGAQKAAEYPYVVGANRDQQYTAASLDPYEVVDQQTGETRAVPRLNVVGGGYGQGGNAGSNAGGVGGYVTKRNPLSEKAGEGMNEDFLKNSYRVTLDDANASSGRLAAIKALRNIDIKTGWGTPAMASAANVLATFGVKDAEKFASNAQQFQSVAMENLMKVLQTQKGPQTEGDAQRASQTFVSLQNTPQANHFIMDFAEAQASLAKKKAAFYQDAMPIARQMGDLTLVDREWQKIAPSVWDDGIMLKWTPRGVK